MSVADPFVTIADRVAPGASLVRQRALTGGVSARVDALELALPDGATRTVVVRRHGSHEWKPLEADVTATEYALLAALRAQGMPVPEVLLLDDSATVLPSPYFVMAFVEGTTALDAAALPEALPSMARFLADLHALNPAQLGVPTLPRRDEPVLETLQYLPADDDYAAVREALTRRGARASRNPEAVVHGDFWTGNVLWRDGSIAAVIDWEDAAVGDPLSDLAGCRIELLWRFGDEAMDAFTTHYVTATGIDTTDLPLWELLVSAGAAATMSEWGLAPEVEEATRRKTMAFMARAGRGALALV